MADGNPIHAEWGNELLKLLQQIHERLNQFDRCLIQSTIQTTRNASRNLSPNLTISPVTNRDGALPPAEYTQNLTERQIWLMPIENVHRLLEFYEVDVVGMTHPQVRVALLNHLGIERIAVDDLLRA